MNRDEGVDQALQSYADRMVGRPSIVEMISHAGSARRFAEAIGVSTRTAERWRAYEQGRTSQGRNVNRSPSDVKERVSDYRRAVQWPRAAAHMRALGEDGGTVSVSLSGVVMDPSGDDRDRDIDLDDVDPFALAQAFTAGPEAGDVFQSAFNDGWGVGSGFTISSVDALELGDYEQ